MWKENIREFMKRIRQRPVRSGGSGGMDRTMWVVRSDEDGDGRMKMGTNPDTPGHDPYRLRVHPRAPKNSGDMGQPNPMCPNPHRQV